MDKLELVLGIVILALSVVITIIVLSDRQGQKAPHNRRSRTFLKQKTGTKDKLLSRITPLLQLYLRCLSCLCT